MTRTIIAIATVLVALGVVTGCAREKAIDEGGGAYAVTPDGRWMATISDAHSNVNDKPYAVVRLWDLNRYPSLRRDIRTYSGKHMEVSLMFPQDFLARDRSCEITWSEASDSFSIVYEAKVPGVDLPLLRTLRYDLEAELGAEVYAAAWERGQAMDLDAVVAEFLAECEE